MATVDVTEQNFNEIAEKGIVLLDFWADWCAPCQAFEPIFAQASARHTGEGRDRNPVPRHRRWPQVCPW